jgi:hypothetical protein
MPRQRAAAAPVIPFVGAALPYRRKYYTVNQQLGGVAQGSGSAVDVSPTGNKIFAYGWLRAHTAYVSTATAASSGGTVGQYGIPGVFNIVQIRQPGGQEMFGGPNFSGWHAYLAQKYSAWRGVNDPVLLPSYANSATSPAIVLRQIFELNHQTGLGCLPNQNDAAPWQAQFSLAAAGTGVGSSFYSVVPTTTNPTLSVQYFIECWTVPSPQNPLRPGVRQMTAPPLAGTLNKWTVQQEVVPGGSAFDAVLIRKGNSIRNLGMVNFTSANALLSTANTPNPLTVQWDGQVVRANDSPVLLIDDDYMTRLGRGADDAADGGRRSCLDQKLRPCRRGRFRAWTGRTRHGASVGNDADEYHYVRRILGRNHRVYPIPYERRAVRPPFPQPVRGAER